MGYTVQDQGMEARVAEENLQKAPGRRIPFENGLYIPLKLGPHRSHP